MDKADYMQISTIFRRGLKEISKDASLLEATKFYMELFCDYLKRDNPKFDEDKFKRASLLHIEG